MPANALKRMEQPKLRRWSAESYLSRRGNGAWMGARGGAPLGLLRGATGDVVCEARVTRAGGQAKPRAEAVSHRQQTRRIAINTKILALIRPPAIGGPVFRISVSKCRLTAAWTGHRRHLTGNLREKGTVASTF